MSIVVDSIHCMPSDALLLASPSMILPNIAELLVRDIIMPVLALATPQLRITLLDTVT